MKAVNTGSSVLSRPKDNRSFHEKLGERCVQLLASGSAVVIILIVAFVLANGVPFLVKTGLAEFILGTTWDPTADEPSYGILPMIVGTGLATFGALAFAVPLGLACAIYISEMVKSAIASVLRSAVELLAGIPSVVYGFFGMVLVVPFIRDVLNSRIGGYSILAGSIVLAIMILPTVISISVDALKSVPVSYREASLALGANEWQTIAKIVLPAARSGIIAAVVLAMGRAIGETMAVAMVMGGVKAMPGASLSNSLFKPLQVFLEPGRTMTATIAMEMGYAAPTHKQALFAIAVILTATVLAFNTFVHLALHRKKLRQ